MSNRSPSNMDASFDANAHVLVRTVFTSQGHIDSIMTTSNDLYRAELDIEEQIFLAKFRTNREQVESVFPFMDGWTDFQARLFVSLINLLTQMRDLGATDDEIDAAFSRCGEAALQEAHQYGC